jgi:hypothetical protein
VSGGGSPRRAGAMGEIDPQRDNRRPQSAAGGEINPIH